MDMKLKEKFSENWQKFFTGAELPIVFYYTDQEGMGEEIKAPPGHQCFVGVLSRARQGRSICFSIHSIGCPGGKQYLGFSNERMPNFEYFLSCGIPGKMEGERYKKSPEIVKELVRQSPAFNAPKKFIVFKRWDILKESDNPEVVIFFAQPDVLAGLFTLANFEEVEPNGVFAPFAAGCNSIVQAPYLEKDSKRPRAVLGMMDVSARPYVPKETLTLAVPMNKFVRMIENMEESFLITPSWEKVKKRIVTEKK